MPNRRWTAREVSAVDQRQALVAELIARIRAHQAEGGCHEPGTCMPDGVVRELTRLCQGHVIDVAVAALVAASRASADADAHRTAAIAAAKMRGAAE